MTFNKYFLEYISFLISYRKIRMNRKLFGIYVQKISNTPKLLSNS